MSILGGVGATVLRKEARDKVAGAVRYAADRRRPGLLQAALVCSPHAHARILSIDGTRALALPGVRALVTGGDTDILCGEVLEDRPPLARDRVRYHGEPVALVVADDASTAGQAALLVDVTYDPLPIVNGVDQALAPGAALVHANLGSYKIAQQPIAPEPGSNVADRARLRKGDPATGWRTSPVTVEIEVSVPQYDHAAMETRCATAQILPDGGVLVEASTQAPFEVSKTLATYFGLSQGQVAVRAPLVGGAFGGKAAVQLEVLAYLASRAVAGRAVQVVNSREQDIHTSPVGAGCLGRVRLGAASDGRLQVVEMTLQLDIGAYTDSAPRVARAIASACTGPYRVEHVCADVLCVYTNHVYTTAFRGFGYLPLTFAVERAMDTLATQLGLDPKELRRRNAIRPGDTTPTQHALTESIIGDLPACLDRVGQLIGWDGNARQELPDGRIRGRGLSALWKTSSSPQDAISGAIITMNKDGGVHLRIGTVECGPGTRTTAAQMLAQHLDLPIEQIFVQMEVDTRADPEHWKTVASMSTFMVGRAIAEAAADVSRQLRSIAGIVLRCPPHDLELAGGRVRLRDDPGMYLEFRDIACGYKYPDGDSIGGQIIGSGCFMMRHLTPLDPETGRGMAGPSWTVGAQAAEVELDPSDGTYRITRAVTVLDAGRVINPAGARAVVIGGMCQGLGCGSREGLIYDANGRCQNDQLRTYKLMRAGEQPEYLVDFIETPQKDGPFGARPIGEHGILGMPAALAAALSAAAGIPLYRLPLSPEAVWRAQAGISR